MIIVKALSLFKKTNTFHKKQVKILRNIITKDPFRFTWNGENFGDINRKIEVRDNIMPFKGSDDSFKAGYVKREFWMEYPDIRYWPPSLPEFTRSSSIISDGGLNVGFHLKRVSRDFTTFNNALLHLNEDDEERAFLILRDIRPRWLSFMIWSRECEAQFENLKRRHEIKRKIENDPDNVTLGDMSSVI